MALISVTLAGQSGNPAHPVAGEPVCDGLAITPEVRAYGADDAAQFSGAWHLTHVPSGLAYTRRAVCISCVRHIAQMAVRSGVDWTRDTATLIADKAVRTTALLMTDVASDCLANHDAYGGVNDGPSL
jgi:hypothetical protein